MPLRGALKTSAMRPSINTSVSFRSDTSMPVPIGPFFSIGNEKFVSTVPLFGG
jgi:hypothetical protein